MLPHMLFPTRVCLLLSLVLAFSASADLRITHGPMLGRPGTDSMGIWIRTSEPGEFTVQTGLKDGKWDGPTIKGITRLDSDCTGWVELKKLKPRTKYNYRVITKDDESAPTGTFSTLADNKIQANAEHNPEGLFNFSFEFACGNNQNPLHGIGPSLPTYTTMLKEIRDKVDFAILNGDWLYEEQREYPYNQWLKQVGISDAEAPHDVKIAPTMVGVWENYKLYLTRCWNLNEWHRHIPSYYTFDDHELLNDIWGAATPGFRNRRAVFRDIGIRAWYHYLGWSNPENTKQESHFGKARLKADSDILFDPGANFYGMNRDEMANLLVHWGLPTAGVHDNDLDKDPPGEPNASTYDVVEIIDKHHLRISPPAVADSEASYSIGRLNYSSFKVANCEFFLLDTKTHRTKHDTKKPADPNVSMIGKRQKEWLISSMKKSDAEFFFVVSSVNFMIPHVGGGGVAFHSNKDEAWTVFLHEREELIETWDSLNKPVFVLSGDLHNSFSIKITDRVWEFASGPHNSVNHTPADEGMRPSTGKFKYGPRECDIRWSSNVLPDVERLQRLAPVYCVVQVNNVYNSPKQLGDERWVAYPHPQVVFQFYDGWTGDFLYAESISTER